MTFFLPFSYLKKKTQKTTVYVKYLENGDFFFLLRLLFVDYFETQE